MRILIIGGTGVLSSALAEWFTEQGAAVTIVTDGCGHMAAPRTAMHLVADRNDISGLGKVLRTSRGWDLVVDAVCYSSRQARLLIPLIRGKTSHTVVVSTSILYSGSACLPTPERCPSDNGLGRYETGKKEMEAAWLSRSVPDELNVTVLRLPHVLGPGCELGIVPLHNRDATLLPRLRMRMPIFLADGGNQIVQFIFARDLARVINALRDRPRAFNRVFNCASPELTLARRYYELIAQILGTEVRVVPVPSDAIRRSGWGWSATMCSRILDTSAIQEIGADISHTQLIEALRACVQHRDDVGFDAVQCDDYSQLERLISKSIDDMADVIGTLAVTRRRSDVDIRMNGTAVSELSKGR